MSLLRPDPGTDVTRSFIWNAGILAFIGASLVGWVFQILLPIMAIQAMFFGSKGTDWRAFVLGGLAYIFAVFQPKNRFDGFVIATAVVGSFLICYGFIKWLIR